MVISIALAHPEIQVVEIKDKEGGVSTGTI